MDGRLTLRARVDGEKALCRFALEVNYLPLRGEAARQVIERYVVDQEREQLLIESVRELVFVGAPFRGEPHLRYEEQNSLAASSRIFERPHPALAGDDAALRVEIEEDVLLAAPPFADQPSLQRERPVIVSAGMTDEQS